MGLFSKFFDDYFDDAAIEISRNGGNDSDEYDEANDPGNPIWDGSEVRYNPFGGDPGMPEPNEVNQD